MERTDSSVGNYYLSGGIFLSLVWDAAQTKNEKGDLIKIFRTDLLRDFKQFVFSIDKKYSQYFRGNVSNYLICKDSGLGDLGFSSFREDNEFDKQLKVQEEYNDILARTTEFLNKWVDPEKSTDLVRRILFILSHDVEAETDLRYIYPDGNVLTKSELLKQERYILPEFFLVIVWLCLIKRANKNESGKETHNEFFKKLNGEWTYCGNIGDAFSNITVSMSLPQAQNTISTNTQGSNDTREVFEETEDKIIVTDIKRNEEQKVNADNSDSKISVYIQRFIEENEQTKLYIYKSASYDIKNVFCPVSLENEDLNLSINDVNVKILSGVDNKRKRTIICGPVGCGKSLLAKKLAIEAADNYSTLGLIPIILDLTSYTNSDESLEAMLREKFDAYIPKRFSSLAQTMIHAVSTLQTPYEFASYCEQGKILILIDSIDKLTSRLKDSFLNKLKTFINNYSKNTIVIFSRPTGRFVEFDTFMVFDIKPFSEQQVDSFINAFSKSFLFFDEDDIKEWLTKKHEELTILSYLYKNPLFLSVVISIVKSQALVLDLKMTEIMEKYISCVLYEDQFLRKPNEYITNLTTYQIREYLCALCTYLVTNNIEAFDCEALDKCRDISIIDDSYSSEDLLDELCRTYGLISFRDGKYEFIDKTIVEYFYVKYLTSHTRDYSVVVKTFQYNKTHSPDNVLDMLCEFSKKDVAKTVYCPYMNQFIGNDPDKSYATFLKKQFRNRKYHFYLGTSDYIGFKRNNRGEYIYSHLVRDLNIEQNIDRLSFEHIEILKSIPEKELEKYIDTTVYNLNKSDAEKIDLKEGFYEDVFGIFEKKFKSINAKPVGYSYAIDINKILRGTDEVSKKLQEILMSAVFPLREEFELALTVCENIECDNY